MNSQKIITLMMASSMLVAVASPSFARDWQQRHPRRAEVLRRDGRLNGDLNRDRGRLGGNYSALKTEDRGIRQQEQADARANGGHITQLQKQQLNGEENQLRQQIGQDYVGKGSAYGKGYGRGGTFAQNHPRRAEVLGRDSHLASMINHDRGDLGGTKQRSLKIDDRSIRQQEQADARGDGGHITQLQKQQLNQEENQLRQQIGQDYTGR